jgi:TolB-like protein/Tfp pilus assembly protein PilF
MQGESPSRASAPTAAVFLSYASEDAQAAQRICAALQAAGIEVWFDQSELRGGDAWDQKIRREIHDCALFIPVISAHSDARREGYFRREWRLAVERTGDMSERAPFLLPVVTDETVESRADVPERFRAVQWTRLPGGETPAAFVERVKRLRSPESPGGPQAALSVSGALGRGAQPAQRLRQRTLTVYAVIAALLLVVLAYFGLERAERAKPRSQLAASIAVLPLANESGDASQQYFSDGISEDLIGALSHLPGLKVIGRTSAFQFRDSKEDSRSIGAKLGVAHLLEGSVRRAGDMVRVSAELIDTSDGSTQWSERYDRPYKDLFALQDQITQAVAGALKVKLLAGEQADAQSDRPPSGSLEAYNAWQQGNFYHLRLSEAGFRKAIEYYIQATQIDPRYARAWSSLSVEWVNLSNYLSGAAAQDAYAKARAAADRALALAPNLAQAHRARAALLLNGDFDWRGAESEARRSLELAPNDGSAKVQLGVVLSVFGENGRCVELIQQAIANDPLRADWYRDLADGFFALDRLDEAERAIRRVIELQPAGQTNYQMLTAIEIERGDADAALAAAQHEPPGPLHDLAVAAALQIGKDQRAADAAVKTVVGKYADDYPYSIAGIFSLRNDANATFEWLERAWTNRDTEITYLLSDPLTLKFKDDPRFAAFCHKVGLPAPGELRQQT